MTSYDNNILNYIIIIHHLIVQIDLGSVDAATRRRSNRLQVFYNRKVVVTGSFYDTKSVFIKFNINDYNNCYQF